MCKLRSFLSFGLFYVFPKKFIFIFIFEYPLRIISELIKIPVDTLIKCYTDVHDVDEDAGTITAQSGMWVNGSDVGITQRTMRDSSSHASSLVASSNTHKI